MSVQLTKSDEDYIIENVFGSNSGKPRCERHAHIPDRGLTMVRLRVNEGCTYKHLADMYGVSTTTVATTFTRSLRRMKHPSRQRYAPPAVKKLFELLYDTFEEPKREEHNL